MRSQVWLFSIENEFMVWDFSKLYLCELNYDKCAIRGFKKVIGLQPTNQGFKVMFLWPKPKLTPCYWNKHKNWTIELIFLLDSKPKPWTNIVENKGRLFRLKS